MAEGSAYTHEADVGRTFTAADEDRVRDFLEVNPGASIDEIIRGLDISREFRDRVGAVAVNSRLPRSNFVNSPTAGFRQSEDSAESADRPVADEVDDSKYAQLVARRATDKVAEFSEKYPHLAGLPLSRQSGAKLRAELVDTEYVEEFVEPDDEWQDGFAVERLDRAEPVTWAEAMWHMHSTRQAYDDGVIGRFETDDGGEFHRRFTDCWTPEYADQQAARNAGAERQLIGGHYPDSDESDRAGEYQEGEWGGVATIMLTRTASSTPGDDRLTPIDHAKSMHSAWNTGTDGVYHAVRNICEKKLELNSDQWGYFRGDDIHGMGDENPGENACYAHSHEAVYIDLEATKFADQEASEAAIETDLEELFYPAIEKHLELCDPAEPEAHEPGKACEAFLDLQHPAAYATEYLRLTEEEELMEMPIEFQAFAAFEWAIGRQRIARSQIFTEAAATDLCKQSPDVEHAGQLTYKRGHGDPSVVCAHCNSAVGIEADTIAEYRLENDPPESDDSGRVLGARVGESTSAARVRGQVREYLESYGAPESSTMLMGELGIDPDHRQVVDDVLEGKGPPGPELVTGEGSPPKSEYRLVGIVRPDGREEAVGGGGGGAEMLELLLPAERLKAETRLQYVGGEYRPAIVLERGSDRLVTFDPDVAAGALVCWGVRKPWHAELCISFRSSGALPSRFDRPCAEPPTSTIVDEGGAEPASAAV